MKEPDYKNFKVICQVCGKTGIVDTTKYVDEAVLFFRRFDCDRMGKEFGEPQIDFWICRECLT